MAKKARYDLEPATQVDIDVALRPFIERFVVTEKRQRAASLFLPLKNRARPRALIDIICAKAIIELDGSSRARTAIAQSDPDLEGIYIVGKPAVFRTRFGRARELHVFGYSDEEIFVGRDGGCALVTFEVGVDWLVAPFRRDRDNREPRSTVP